MALNAGSASMASTTHHVTFRFTLPPALSLRAPPGCWPRCPRGVNLDVGEQGCVLVTSVDHHMSYATKQVLTAAARFLAAIGADVPCTSLRGFLSTPETRARSRGDPTRYAIALGAKVAITRVLIEEEPTLLAAEAPMRLATLF
jgi:hypothetical protein